MAHKPVRRLAFPVDFPDLPAFLVEFRVTREAAHRELGSPHQIEWVDGLGNSDFWAFEYPCGLQVVYEFVHLGPAALALADSPEVEHVIRHSPFDRDVCFPMTEEGLSRELERLRDWYPSREREVSLLHGFQVWRQDDNGNVFRVGEPTSERDAVCLVNQLESSGHKQTYWYVALTAQ